MPWPASACSISMLHLDVMAGAGTPASPVPPSPPDRNVSHARGLSPIAGAPVLAGQFIDAGVPEWCGARQTRRMYSAPTSTNAPQAQRQWRLRGHARDQGFADLGSYLQARCQRHASPAQLASELGTTTTVVHHLLATAGITAPPRRVSAARKRRTTTDQQLAARAAELGFASLGEYLTDRAMTRRWPSTMIASELGVQPGTVRDRLDQHRLARLAELGFADVAAYLQLRRVQQGSSLRRMLAELQVGSAWLKGQMARLRIP